MPTAISSKRTTVRDAFVRIPRKEYEALLGLKKLRTFTPTSAQKRALAQAELNLKYGKTLTCDELAKRLGFEG